MKEVLFMNGRTFSSPQTLMAQLGISEPTFYRWIKAGLIPKPIKIGRGRFFDQIEVEMRLARGQ